MNCIDCGIEMGESYTVSYDDVVAGAYQHDESEIIECPKCGEIYDVPWLEKYWSEQAQADLI